MTTTENDASVEIEDLDTFRERARTHIRANLDHVGSHIISLSDRGDDEELAGVARDREVQRILFDGGLAGICVPGPSEARASRLPTRWCCGRSSPATSTRCASRRPP